MSLINSSYFIGEKDIPNTTYAEVADMISNLILVYEEKYLETFMGYELYKKFKDGIAEVTPEVKWTKIKNGTEFTGQDGQLKKWKGLVDTTTYESPIAYYCYWYYLKRNATQSASMGEVRTDNANSTPASPRYKMANALNKMVELNKVLHDFLVSNYSDYPEYATRPSTTATRSMLTFKNPYGI